eukprot:CAMPEP_0180460738 /NCGR_PEP_ID=MMETSP1036_2-20121128/23520_1 /TAXON_ID=632150 /ORGANISM="Azadinium spinosum, Strain 3D9" /LENGTH=56 /DNA_ID=CAMNT_0022467441 /DNA_START=640 /DNA_END=810 /DNA_ORIENTATION=-
MASLNCFKVLEGNRRTVAFSSPVTAERATILTHASSPRDGAPSGRSQPIARNCAGA